MFCERAWDLEQRGVQPSVAAAAKRSAGSSWHKEDSARIVDAPKQHRLGVLLVSFSVIALIVMFLLAIRHGTHP